MLDDGIAFAERTEVLGFVRYLQITRAVVHLARAEWDDAERRARFVDGAPPMMRPTALVVLGLSRVRRGRPGGRDLLNEAWALANRIGEAQRLGPAGEALAEEAWLRGDASAVDRLAPVYLTTLAAEGGRRLTGFGFWLRQLGADVPLGAFPHPYALLAAGHATDAAARWAKAGSRYEQALALSHGPGAGPDDLLAAVRLLDGIGAEPLARRLRSRLRELGVHRIPRGPAPSTRENAAGLTGRQAEVLRLLAAGLSNPEIAARLVLSTRTVDAHVSAILTKLTARSRRDAVSRARSLGLLPDGDSGGPGTRAMLDPI